MGHECCVRGRVDVPCLLCDRGRVDGPCVLYDIGRVNGPCLLCEREGGRPFLLCERESIWAMCKIVRVDGP